MQLSSVGTANKSNNLHRFMIISENSLKQKQNIIVSMVWLKYKPWLKFKTVCLNMKSFVDQSKTMLEIY